MYVIFIRCDTCTSNSKHTHTRLMALFPGLSGSASARKVKPIWILLKQRDSEWQWHQLDHMQVCTLLQANNHASTPPLSFYRPDALPATQPTVTTEGNWILLNTHWENTTVGRELAERHLDANTEATGNCKSMSEIVNHVSQKIQPATSLQTACHAFTVRILSTQ